MRRVPVMIVNETVLFPKVEYRIETQDEKTEKLINTIEQSKDQHGKEGRSSRGQYQGA